MRCRGEGKAEETRVLRGGAEVGTDVAQDIGSLQDGIPIGQLQRHQHHRNTSVRLQPYLVPGFVPSSNSLPFPVPQMPLEIRNSVTISTIRPQSASPLYQSRSRRNQTGQFRTPSTTVDHQSSANEVSLPSRSRTQYGDDQTNLNGGIHHGEHASRPGFPVDPLRLRGGGSGGNGNGASKPPAENGSRSASASASASSEHDAIGQANRESTTSSSSFDINQYQAEIAREQTSQQQRPLPVVAQTYSSTTVHLNGSSNTPGQDAGFEKWQSGPVAAGASSAAVNPYRPVPLAIQNHGEPSTYITARTAGTAQYQQLPQQFESHSRSHQQTARSYSVSDSVTSSGTSYNEYNQPTGGGASVRGVSENGEGGAPKGKGKASDEDDSGIGSGVALGQDTGVPGDSTNKPKRHRRTTSSVSRKTDDSASYPTEFTAQLLTGLSKPPAPQKTTTLTTSGKKQNLPPSAYPHLRPGDTVTDPNTPHIHGCPYCNKVYRGQHARSICRRHQMSKHGIELEVQVKKSRWDNNPNRPATEQEKHQRTLESKRRWAAKDRKRRRCLKLGITYISSSDEDASGSDDDESLYNAVAGPSSDHLAVAGSARSARSRSRSGSVSQTPEFPVDRGASMARTGSLAGGKPGRRGSSALQQVAFPEDEDEQRQQSGATSRRAGKKRAGSKQTVDPPTNRSVTVSGSAAGASTDLPFTSEPMEPVIIVKTEDGHSTSQRKTGSSRRTADRLHPEISRQGSLLARYVSTGVPVSNGDNMHPPVAMVPTHSHPSQAIIYQPPVGDPPVFMNIPEGARVYAVQYRDDPRTGYRVVSAPQPVQFFIPPTDQAHLPLRRNSAPPEDLLARTAGAIMPPDVLSPVIGTAEVQGTLAPPVVLRPEQMRRNASLNQFPAPIPSHDGDVFSARSANVPSEGSRDESGSRLMRAAIRRSSDDGPETEARKNPSSQDSDSNEEAAEILLAFSNSPARSVTASAKKHARHQSMDAALSGKRSDMASSSGEIKVLAGSSRLQDVTTGLQINATTPGDVIMEGEDESTPVATRTRPPKPPPIRPASEETPFQRANLWPARQTNSDVNDTTEDDPFRVPEVVQANEVDESRTPGELAPPAYIMAPPPRPTRPAAPTFRQPKEVIPSSSTHSGLSSPPGLEPSSKAAEPTPKPSALRSGLTPHVGGSRMPFATPARQDWVASSPALGHPFSSPSGLDLTHKLGLAADMSTVPDSPSWLELVRATPDAKNKRNRTESLDGETGAELADDTPGKRLRL